MNSYDPASRRGMAWEAWEKAVLQRTTEDVVVRGHDAEKAVLNAAFMVRRTQLAVRCRLEQLLGQRVYLYWFGGAVAIKPGPVEIINEALKTIGAPKVEQYLVYVQNGQSPRMIHTTYEEALAEAKRLCKKTGLEAFVLCAVGKFVPPAPAQPTFTVTL